MSTAELLISSDSHASVSHDSVKRHLASKFHEDYDGAVAEFGLQMATTMGRVNQSWQSKEAKDAGAAAKAAAPGNTSTNSKLGIPGHSDPHARLADMDLDGVQTEVVYCEVSAFRYLYLLKNGSLEATRAFNDTMIEFGSVDPTRLIVNAQIPIHDIGAAISEVHRVAGLGVKSLQLPVFPPELGLPDYYDERYHPLWAAITETGLPICCHIGLNRMLDGLAERDPTPGKSVMIPCVGLSTGEAIGMWILGGVFERFPDLKVVYVEPGLGWMAWWLFIADDMVLRQGYQNPLITNLPSEYFHRNVFLTFIDEPDALGSPLIRERLGTGNIMWSTDYPHPVTSWPNSRSLVEEQFQDVPAADRELILRGNATRVWNL